MSAANSSPNSAELGAGRRVEVNNSDITAPMVSAATSLLYCAHKENGDYQYVGLDWMPGALRERWTFPDDSRLWNAFGGITTIVEDGDLLISAGASAAKVWWGKEDKKGGRVFIR